MRKLTIFIVTIISFVIEVAISGKANIFGMFIYSWILVAVTCHWCLDENGLPIWKKFPKVMATLAALQATLGTIITYAVYVQGTIPFLDFAQRMAPVLFIALVIQDSIFGAFTVLMCKTRQKSIEAEVVE